MLEPLEAIEHVGEIARLFYVVARWGKPRMEEQALIEASKHTAGITGRYPHPAPAIRIAVSAGLLTRSRGSLLLTARGHQFAAQTAGAVDLTTLQAKLLLAAILDQKVAAVATASLISNFQLVRGQLTARKNAIAPGTAQVLLCRIFQQLGALAAAGDYYVVSRQFECLLAHLVIRAAKLTQAELLERLELQRKRGLLAEQKAIEIEKDRLVKLGRPDLAARVEHISPQDVSAGYDIKSFEKNVRPRLIEVKSSVGSRITFEWSAVERATAAKHGDAYFIYFVPFSFALPDLTAPLALLKNPIELIRSARLIEVPTSFQVTEPQPPSVSEPKQHQPPGNHATTYVYQ